MSEEETIAYAADLQALLDKGLTLVGAVAYLDARKSPLVFDPVPDVAAVNALPELLALRETLKDVVDWYDKEHPMRQADWHNPKCGCVRCKFDRARAALNQEGGQ